MEVNQDEVKICGDLHDAELLSRSGGVGCYCTMRLWFIPEFYGNDGFRHFFD